MSKRQQVTTVTLTEKGKEVYEKICQVDQERAELFGKDCDNIDVVLKWGESVVKLMQERLKK